MAKQENELLVMTFPEKIADLKANFGVTSPIVRVYERLHFLLGDKPTEEQLSEAISLVSFEIDNGKFANGKPKV